LGNGITKIYSLPSNVFSSNSLVVHVDGIYQQPGLNFTANVSTLEFFTAPSANAEIIVQNSTPVIDLESRWYAPFSQNITADGSSYHYQLAGNIAGQNSLIVHVNRIYQIPGVSFVANNTHISFYSPPAVTSEINLQHSGTLIAAGGGGGGSQVIVSGNAPANPIEGDLWLDNDNGKLSVYLANGWVEVGGSSSLFTANDFVIVGGIECAGNITTGNLIAVHGIYTDKLFYANGAPYVISGVGGNATVSSNITLTTGAIIGNPAGISVNTSAVAIDQFGAADIRTAKYIISVTQSNEYQATEALITHNGAQSQLVTYGTVYTGNSQLMTFSTGISSNNVVLYGTGSGSGNVVKLQKTYVKV